LSGRTVPTVAADTTPIFRFSGPLPSGPRYRMWVMPHAVVLDVAERPVLVCAQRLQPEECAWLATALRETSLPLSSADEGNPDR